MAKWTRRSALKGMLGGSAVTIALPLLDCFLDGNGEALASGAPLPVRFGTWFWACGCNEKRFFPDKVGSDFEFKAETMPLAPIKNKVTVFSGFNAILNGAPNLTHWTGVMCMLGGTTPTRGGNGVGSVPASTINRLVADHTA